jgi:hypothetical protein
MSDFIWKSEQNTFSVVDCTSLSCILSSILPTVAGLNPVLGMCDITTTSHNIQTQNLPQPTKKIFRIQKYFIDGVKNGAKSTERV